MGQQSKRTRAPAPQPVPPSMPQSVPPSAPQPVPPPPHLVLPSAFTSRHGPGSWIPPRPPQSMAPSSAPSWLAGLQQPSIAGDSAQGPCLASPAVSGGSTSPWYMTGNIDDSDPQAWGMDSHPPGGFLSFFKNTSSQAQAVSNGTPQQPINVGDDNNGGNCPRTEKRLLWTKEEDLRLVSAWKDHARFGVLQSRFTIVRRPARLWKRKSVGRIMLACVILHNMIVEDEREQVKIHIDLNENPGASFALPPEVNVGGNLCFADVLRRKATIRARPQHTQLKNDLIEHIWHRFQNNRHN